MKTNIQHYLELHEHQAAIEHLADRGIKATIREDKKIVCEQADYARAKETLERAYKWGELTTPATVTTLKEHFDLDSIVKRFPAEVKDFRHNGEMGDDLFHALYDYYFDDMPYGTKKARDGDPYEWVADRFDSALQSGDVLTDNSEEGQGDMFDQQDEGLEEGNGAHMFVTGETVYWNNKRGLVDRQEGDKVFVHVGHGEMDVWPADETSLNRQGALPTMRKHINDIGRGLKGFMTGKAEESVQEGTVAEKAKNPYAIGMAAAEKSTGDDTPPLKKSTIKKGHEIAKKIKAEESVNADVEALKRLSGLK